jgi:hypothetical protein
VEPSGSDDREWRATLRMAVIMVHHPSSDGRFGGALRPAPDGCMAYAPSGSLSLADGSHCFRMVADTAGQAIKAELRFNSRGEYRETRVLRTI